MPSADSTPPFTYLVTVHNKEALLPDVLSGVARSAKPTSRVVIVLDGCTDRSKEIAGESAARARFETIIVEAPDVHEIRSINIGLQHAGAGYVIVLQDDVVLDEPDLERMVHELCEASGRTLGLISLRLAADVRRTRLLDRVKLAFRQRQIGLLLPSVDEVNHVATPHEHLDVLSAEYGSFVPRMVGIKSPICLTPELRLHAPFLDADFAPYCYDDYDMSLRALNAGLTNGLFPVRFRSEVEWGGTRHSPEFSSKTGARIRLRNRRLVWKKHHRLIRKYRSQKFGL